MHAQAPVRRADLRGLALKGAFADVSTEKNQCGILYYFYRSQLDQMFPFVHSKLSNSFTFRHKKADKLSFWLQRDMLTWGGADIRVH